MPCGRALRGGGSPRSAQAWRLPCSARDLLRGGGRAASGDAAAARGDVRRAHDAASDARRPGAALHGPRLERTAPPARARVTGGALAARARPSARRAAAVGGRPLPLASHAVVRRGAPSRDAACVPTLLLLRLRRGALG